MRNLAFALLSALFLSGCLDGGRPEVDQISREDHILASGLLTCYRPGPAAIKTYDDAVKAGIPSLKASLEINAKDAAVN